MDKKEYAKIVKRNSPNSKCGRNCLVAFLIGGAICALGQGITEGCKALGLSKDDAGTVCSVSLIFLGVLLTALHIYDNIAKHAGAGTLVPITGFANAMSSPAIEFRGEGFITGLGAKLFVIAGPVIVYGVTSATLYGAVIYVLGFFGL